MLLWLYALVVGIASVMILLQYAGVHVIGEFIHIADPLAATAVVMLLVSLFFLIYRTGPSKTREPQMITHKMENGDVKIAVDTLEQLATRAAGRIRGVRDLKTRVRANEAGLLRIAVRCAVEADLDIPKTTKELQDSVKSYVEQTAGLPVEQVIVYVSQVAQPQEAAKKRVE